MEKTDKRKLIDWNKKSGNDSERISKRLEGRSELDDSITTKNATKPKTLPPATAKGAPLLKLRKKIREVYDDEDEDEDEVTAPFFNISLIEDDELEYDKQREEAERTMRIAKQQQIAGKLNLALDTAVLAEKAGFSASLTKEDAKMIHSDEYTPQKMRRRMIHKKIEQPLGLTGELSEKNIEKSITGIKRAKNEFSSDSLQGFPAENVSDLAEEMDEEDMAKLILKKSGRKMPKKSLVEIAKGINRYESHEHEQLNKRQPKEKE